MLSSLFKIFSIKASNKSDIIYMTILQGMNFAIPIVLMPYLMIKLETESYGYVGFSYAVVQYFILITNFGFNLSATKKIAIYKDDREKLSHIFYSTFYAKLFLLFVCVLIFIALLFVPQFKVYQYSMMLTFPTVIGIVFTFDWFFQGIGRIRLLSIISIGSRIVILPSIFFVVKSPADYPVAITIQSFVYIFTAFVSSYWLYRSKRIKKIRINIIDVKLEIKDSFPLFLSSAATSFYTRFFTIFLGFTSTVEIVGCYSAAEKIVRSLCSLFYIPINQIYYPKIAYLAGISKDEAYLMFKKIKKYTFITMFILSCFIFIGAPILEYFLSEYKGLAVLLKILSPIPLFISIGGIYGQMGLIALGDNKSKQNFQQTYFFAALFALIIVIILSYFWSENGVALAVLLTEVLVTLFMYYFFRKSYLRLNITT